VSVELMDECEGKMLRLLQELKNHGYRAENEIETARTVRHNLESLMLLPSTLRAKGSQEEVIPTEDLEFPRFDLEYDPYSFYVLLAWVFVSPLENIPADRNRRPGGTHGTDR